MYNYEYVDRSEYMPEKLKIVSLLQDVQRDLRGTLSVQFKFVGSASRNMVTRDKKSNIGYDFDVNLWVKDVDRYNPKYLRQNLKKSIDKFVKKYGYSEAEDSTSVLTIKVKDKKKSAIKHSCDFAIVKRSGDEDDELLYCYIKHDKKNGSYVWEERSQEYYKMKGKIKCLQKEGLWNDVRKQYIINKNKNVNHHKSRSIFAYTISEVYNWYYEPDSNNSRNVLNVPQYKRQKDMQNDAYRYFV